ISAASCAPSGPKMHEVTGTITFDGKPVTHGEIVFSPQDAKHSADGAQIQPDGTYTVRVKEGQHTVRIIGLEAQKPASGRKHEPDDEPSMVNYHSYIPEKFNTKSELRAEVNEPKRIDFELKSK